MDTATLASTEAASRIISHKARGRPAGPVSRLVSPSDLGQSLKPFVFLDLFDMHGTAPGFGLHPHSGIATITVVTDGHVSFDDPVSGQGVIGPGKGWTIRTDVGDPNYPCDQRAHIYCFEELH